MSQEFVSVPRDWLTQVSLMQMSHDELQDQAVGFLCEPCDEPVPPAGGEVLPCAKLKVREMESGRLVVEAAAFDAGQLAERGIISVFSSAHVTRLQAENAALQQRLNVADQRVDDLTSALDICSNWFTKHSPTAPLIGGFGEAEHPMLTFIRGAQSASAAKDGD